MGVIQKIVGMLSGSFKGDNDDFAGNPFDPQQIKQRRENLEKILALAAASSHLTNEDVQKRLGISDAMATRYLTHLADLGKLIKISERGQQAYYKLPFK